MLSPEDAQQEIKLNEHHSEYYIAISRPPSAFSEDKTLFLGGLPHNTTVEKVKEVFREEEAHIIDVRLKINDKMSVGYIDFESQESRDKAYEKNRHHQLLINDKKVMVQLAETKPLNARRDIRVVILKQLSFKATEKDIVSFFKDFTIEDVFIPKADNGKARGFGFVKFKNND
jgi:RNA recognition motif-containing protein